MEAKTTRAAVLAACLLVLLLSGQPAPVSGSVMSRYYKDKYCKCFRKCYTPCRINDHQPWPACKIRCGGKCIFPYGVPAASAAALVGSRDGAWREICLASIGCSTDAAAATTGNMVLAPWLQG